MLFSLTLKLDPTSQINLSFYCMIKWWLIAEMIVFLWVNVFVDYDYPPKILQSSFQLGSYGKATQACWTRAIYSSSAAKESCTRIPTIWRTISRQRNNELCHQVCPVSSFISYFVDCTRYSVPPTALCNWDSQGKFNEITSGKHWGAGCTAPSAASLWMGGGCRDHLLVSCV